jgi:hypothetical protein
MLTSWSARTVGSVRQRLALSREVILRLDKARENRMLSLDESWLHKTLKATYLGLASLERTIARQRTRLTSLKDGDANSAYFHQHSSFRRQKNRIYSVLSDGHVLTDHKDMAEAAFAHFDAMLGTDSTRDISLELQELITPSENLQDLDAPFTEAEIWSAIKRLPARKAPGPDGFTAEFLRACWSTIKDDMVQAFAQIQALRGRGFHRLNQELLTLLPKKPDAATMGEYRPISLIHLVAKLVAKTLSLRLAPKLDDLVSKNQNAFIPGRSLHDNFVLTRQSARLLHQLRQPRVLLKLDLARAFDTISWPFLFEVLRQYGFNDMFLDWLAQLFSSASTRVLINGEPSPPISHRRGLHLGDPLSPQLFVPSTSLVG